jgi:4'-phosphopantetheinyl transferase
LSLDENGAAGNDAVIELPHVVALPSPAPGVRLWSCALHATASQLRAYAHTLSTAERARRARFGTPLLRDRYVVGRAALRTVLAAVLGVTARDVVIVRGARGRPQLEAGAALDFNVSHTGDMALICVTGYGRIGVDVERADRSINVSGFARKFLTPSERDRLAALDSDRARRDVLTLWTCKEAMSKATGEALSAPFAGIDVDLRNGRVLHGGPDPYRPARWTLHAVSVPGDYLATVALWAV